MSTKNLAYENPVTTDQVLEVSDDSVVDMKGKLRVEEEPKESKSGKRHKDDKSYRNGWKLAAGVAGLCLGFAVVVCCITAFSYHEERTARIELKQDIARRFKIQTAIITDLIDRTYLVLQRELNELAELVDRESDRIVMAIMKQTVNITRLISEQDKMINGLVQAQSNDMTRLFTDQDDLVENTERNQSVYLTEMINAEEQTVVQAISTQTTTMQNLFNNQTTFEAGELAALLATVTSKALNQNTLLGGKLDDLSNATARLFTAQDVTIATEFSGIDSAVVGKSNAVISQITTSVPAETTTIANLIEVVERNLSTAISAVDSNIPPSLSTVQSILITSIDGAKNDVKMHMSGSTSLVTGAIGVQTSTLSGKISEGTIKVNTTLKAVETDIKDSVTAQTTQLENRLDDVKDKVKTVETNITDSETSILQSLTAKTTTVTNKIQDAIYYEVPQSCSEVRYKTSNNWDSDSDGGVFTIYPPPFVASGLSVYCDVHVDDGGWLLIQRRVSNSIDFSNKTFNDYDTGFGGVLDGNYWLGLGALNLLTTAETYKLRIDMISKSHGAGPVPKKVVYKTFSVGTRGDEFPLTISRYSSAESNVPDALSAHDGFKFSAYDRDNDDNVRANCADKHKGGWWYGDIQSDGSCFTANLNGEYYRPCDKYDGKPTADGIEFGAPFGKTWNDVEMKIKKVKKTPPS